MDKNDLFTEKIKSLNDTSNLNRELFNQRLNTKLSLRKRKVDDILYNKRGFGNIKSDYNDNNNNKITWKLLYDIKTLKLKYNLEFKENEDEKILSTASKYLKSNDLDDIRYGIILTQIFIKRNFNQDLTNSINLLFIYELFHIIEKFNKEEDIIFNILDIIISYSSINTDKNLATILLSPDSYKIWELCFNLQNFEIFYEIISIFNNIVQDNIIGGCNLIRSNFLQNQIYNFYNNDNIIAQKTSGYSFIPY